MNCRHIKTICNNINFKSLSTYPRVKAEQLYSCFQKNPEENLRSLKFVPKEKALKISAETYHDASKQAMISKRIVSLRKEADRAENKVLTHRLRTLMQLGQTSLMNLSTKKIVKSRNVKKVSKHSTGSSKTGPTTNFERKPKELLKNLMLSYSESAPKRFGSTESVNLLPQTRQARMEREMSTSSQENKGLSQQRADKLSLLAKARRELADIERQEKKVFNSDTQLQDTQESLELALNIRDKLDDLSSRIKDDLLVIDGSLKDKLKLMKKKINKGIVGARQNDLRRPQPEYTEEKLFDTKLELMPVKEQKSMYEVITQNSQALNISADPSLSNPHNTVQIRRLNKKELRSNDLSEGESYRLSGLMDVSQANNLRRTTRNRHKRNEHIIEIKTKVAADADGVYFAPIKAKANNSNSS